MIDPDLAARLTILYLRAAVPAESPLREDACAVAKGNSTPTEFILHWRKDVSKLRLKISAYEALTTHSC